MKNQWKRFLPILLGLILCFGFSATAWAADQSLSLKLDQSEVTAGTAQTVTMTVELPRAVKAGGYELTCVYPETFSIDAINNDDERVGGSLASQYYNLDNGMIKWFDMDLQDENLTKLAQVTFHIPANTAAGTYEIGVKEVAVYAESGRATVFELPEATTLSLTVSGSSGGGGGGGGTVAKEYTVTLPTDLVNGKVAADKSSAAKGETVTITVTPDNGYELEQISVTDQKGHSVDLKDLGNGKYSFTMPASAVTVEAAFTTDLDEDCPSARFTDVKQDGWYHEAIDYVVEEGMMNGISDTLFAPNDSTTRAMIATILWRLEGSPEVDASMDYQDVVAGSWYEEAVRWATQAGVVEGYGNGTFLPNGDITREEMATMLYRYAEYKGVDTETVEDADLDRFGDVASISAWAIDAMNWACGTGLIQGTPESNLEPGSGATRAEAAQLLRNYSLEIAA